MTSFRDTYFLNQQVRKTEKKLNHDHDFSLTWEIVAVSHTFIWHCLLTNFFLKNREGIQPSMLVKKNSGQYGAVKDVKKNSESNVDKQNLFGFPLMQKSE